MAIVRPMAQIPVNVSHWRNFLRVADLGSFSRVADLHGIAQPAISRQMRQLEETLGVDLFVRSVRGAALTPAGRHFQERAADILGQLDGLRDELAGLADEPSGDLTIGLPISLGPMLAAPFVRFVRDQLPKVRPSIVIGTTIEIAEALVSRRCEIGILFDPVGEQALTADPLVRDPLVLIGPAEAALEPNRSIGAADLCKLPLIFTSRTNVVRQRLEGAFAAIGVSPRTALEIESTTITHLVESGLGYAPMPSAILADKSFAGRTSHCPIEGLHLIWCLSHLRSETLSPPAARARAWLCDQLIGEMAEGSWKAEPI